MSTKSKCAFGAKEDIDTAKSEGTIDNYDLLLLDNGEMGWIDRDGNTVISKDCLKEELVVNGVDGLGVPSGTTYPIGTPTEQILRAITSKAIPATYTRPTVAIANDSGQAAGGVEAGTSITAKLKATFTKNDAGDLTAISIKKNGTDVETGTTSPLSYTGEAIVIGDETINYSASATYEDAPVKNNNLGNESKENWFAGGTITSSNYSISGQRNLFYGTGVGSVPSITSDIIRGLANKKLNPTQGYSFNINVAVGQQYIMFAYPATLRDVNNVTYVEANDSGMAANFAKTDISVADARGGENGLISYKCYSYAMAIPAAASMTFKVTI